MNVTCTACRQSVKRYDAVIRGNGATQLAFHRACFTIERAVNGIDTAAVKGDVVVGSGWSLSERLAIRKAHAARR